MEREIKEYQSLNQVAKTGGVIIFGEHKDREIPVGELRESFNLEYSAYNRSFSDLTLDNAVELYDSCVASLSPDTVMLHIGNNGEYWKDISGFEQKYIALIKHIKEVSKGVRVVVVSVNDEETNRHLKNIADSAKVDYQNVLHITKTNPQSIRCVNSFLQTIGLGHLKRQTSAYDLAKIFFRYA